ncbi:hypothetical protein EJ110_NYTH25667 [Nymphaea thermarum]|nr:hypothetical protein EJ110_NYTH25667 [Nymphaea thermarum]
MGLREPNGRHSAHFYGSSCRLGSVVDGRSYLKQGPRSAPYRYFGNVVSIPFGEATVEGLKRKPLGRDAKNVNEFLGFATNTVQFQGLIDYVEGQRPNPIMRRVCYRGFNDGATIVVSHERFLDPSKMNFGWGLPFSMSVHCPWEGDARLVVLLPSPQGNVRALPLGRRCQTCGAASKPPREWRLCCLHKYVRARA